MASSDASLLPRGWTKTVRSSVLHAIAVTFTTLTRAWASASTNRRRPVQMRAEIDRATTEIALLNEELAIKSDRIARVPPRRRPHYGPVDRMRILQLRAARGWSVAQTAEAFAVTEDTIASWLRRADEHGEHPLVRTVDPVNRFPDYVAYLVRQLKVLCPTLGKARIAHVLARAGLQLGATTVGRILRERPPPNQAADAPVIVKRPAPSPNTLRARRPDHIWHVDLTAVPTSGGFWVPWLPFAKVQRWPFCWWVAVVIDQWSRRVTGFALFAKMPTSTEICCFLDRAIKRADARPKYVVSDKGKQFSCATFRSWCRQRGVRPRFGALGRSASIAVVERFIRSMKVECTRRIRVPFELAAMRHELACYVTWFNEYRPHQALSGKVPDEVYRDRAHRPPVFETRSMRAQAPNGVQPVNRLTLAVRFFEGRRHLPIVELRPAA